MTLDLKRVFAEPGAVLPIETQQDLSAVDHAGAFPLKKPVLVQGAVSNRAGMVELKLQMTYEYEGFCDRCGAAVCRTFTVPFERALATAIEGEDSDTILTVPDMRLDVDELVFTEVYVSLPTKFLCRQDCKGLCPQCGKNLNGEGCNCPKSEPDPRLAVLADLLNQS